MRSGAHPPEEELADKNLAVRCPQHWPPFDVIVIGGGINGCGIAREAALRGLTVLLLEKEDFGSGTSAYSSRLIHGGLRYLENLELDLVYESLQERERLLKNAPHLVRPLQLGIPVYAHHRKPAWMIQLGLWLYDALSGGKRLPNHRMLSRHRFFEAYPMLRGEGLRGGPVYSDAQALFPERICLENALSAEETGLATLLNHARVTGFERTQDTLTGVTFTDALTGESHTVSGQVVFNASGPWVDALLQWAAPEDASLPRRLGGTQGSHLVVKAFPGAPATALYVEARADGRPFFILPWRGDTWLIGTTDRRYDRDLDTVAADNDEVAYLLSETNAVLPQARLTADDVLYTYSGVRPLPASNVGQAGRITRKHLLEDHARQAEAPLRGLISIIGGKLTTYRSLAEEALDYAVKAYHLPVSPETSMSSRKLPLPGGEGIDALESYAQAQLPVWRSRFRLPPETGAHLLSIYGSRTPRVLALLKENPDWRKPLRPGFPDIAAQVVYAARHEHARTLSDVLLRRLGCAFDPDLARPAVLPAAELLQSLLGWTEAEKFAQMEAYERFLQQRFLAFRQPLSVPTEGAAV